MKKILMFVVAVMVTIGANAQQVKRALKCPDNSVYGFTYKEKGSMTGYTFSDAGRVNLDGYEMRAYTSFSDNVCKIGGIHFYGYGVNSGRTSDNSRFQLDEDGNPTVAIPIEIQFCKKGSNGYPGDLVYEYNDTLLGKRTGVRSDYGPIFTFDCEFDKEVELEEGWVAIAAGDDGNKYTSIFSLLTHSNMPNAQTLVYVYDTNKQEEYYMSTGTNNYAVFCFTGTGEYLKGYENCDPGAKPSEDEDAENWESLGNCRYTDGFLPAVYTSREYKTYEVEIQKSKVDAGRFRLVTPYGQAYTGTATGDNDGKTHYMYVNATAGNDKVYIEDYHYTGLDLGDGNINLTSAAGYNIAKKGYGPTSPALSSLMGTYDEASGTITMPEGSLWLNLEYGTDVNGGFIGHDWIGTNGLPANFKIVLPGFEGKSDLATEIATAKTVLAQIENTTAYQPLADAISAAEAVLNNPESTNDDYKTQVTALKAAEKTANEFITARTLLTETIAKAEDVLAKLNSESEMYSNFEFVIFSASAVLGSEESTTADFNDQVTLLNAEIKTAEEYIAALDTFKAAYEKVKALQPQLDPETEAEALALVNAALEDAETLLANADASIEDIKTQTETLQNLIKLYGKYPIEITTKAELTKDHVYSFTTQRGSWTINSDATQMGGTKQSGFTDATEEMQQFAVLDIDGGLRLYSPAAKKFVNRNGSSAELKTGSTNAWDFEEDGGYLVAKVDGQAIYVNLGGSNQMVLDSWSTHDAGNKLTVLAEGKFTAEQYAEALEIYGGTTPDPDPEPTECYHYMVKSYKDQSLYVTLNTTSNKVELTSEETTLCFWTVSGETDTYYISNEDESGYIGYKGSDTWTMCATPANKARWTVTVSDGAYELISPDGKGTWHGLGADDVQDGAELWGDKSTSRSGYDGDKCLWLLEAGTGIDEVVGSKEQVAGSREQGTGIYNLAGQKVDESYKGIVIVEGKKVKR